jgi:hypothetical protein
MKGVPRHEHTKFKLLHEVSTKGVKRLNLATVSSEVSIHGILFPIKQYDASMPVLWGLPCNIAIQLIRQTSTSANHNPRKLI